MLAALSALLLFIFLTLLGKAVMEALSFRFSILRGWLLAPSVGLAVVVLLTLNINQIGLPVKTFAVPLAVALAVFVSAVFWRKRPVFPWKQLAPFSGAAILSLLYTCWPMFQHGFLWFGYLNGDMLQYCTGATRAMNHGFYQVPTLQELNGTDYTQFMWFHSAVGMFRCGADILLAWVASMMHNQPLRMSMPTLGAAEMAQLWSAAALVLTSSVYRRVAWVTVLLVAVSPFYILGVLSQLLPQVGGLALLFCLCSLCMKPFPASSLWRAILPSAALMAAIAATLCIYYPEVLPFGGLAIVAYHGWSLIQRKERLSSVAAVGVPALILLAVLARQALFTAIGTIVFTLASMAPGQFPSKAFDRVLDPSIFASLPGLQAYYGQPRDPWMSVAIVIGMALLLLCAGVGCRCAWKGQPVAFVLLIMLAMGVRLFSTHAAFGVFKLAMYVQPMYLFSLAVVAVRVLRKSWYLAPALYLPATLATSILYVSTTPSSLPGINDTFVHALPLGPGNEMVVSAQNQIGAMLYASESVGTNVKWADFNYFLGATATDFMPAQFLPLPGRIGLTKDNLTPALALRNILIPSNSGQELILGHEVSRRNPPSGGPRISYLGRLTWDPWDSSNNTHFNGEKDGGYFRFDPMDAVQNYLVLLTSSLGGPMDASATSVSRWSAQKDVYNPSGTFYGVGRNLLFEVIRPTPGARLRVSLTRTLTGGGHTVLPETAEVRATAKQYLGFVGSGAANITSAPLQLYERNGRFYLALDFGTAGNYFPSNKTGLLRMFHTDIPIDYRQMVGFARDIALVTGSQYSSLERPTSITSWPAGLLSNPNLEFSGIYEDGWISNRAFVILGKAKAGDQLHITGQIPGLPRFATSGNGIRVLLNGEQIYQDHLKPGRFEIANTLPADSAKNRVDFFFDRMEPLPAGDDRPVSAQLLQIAIQGGGAGPKTQEPPKREPQKKVIQPILLSPQAD